MRLGAEIGEFGGGDPGEPPRPILRAAEEPAGACQRPGILALDPQKLAGEMSRAGHDRAAALLHGAAFGPVAGVHGRRRLLLIINGGEDGSGLVDQHAGGAVAGGHDRVDGVAAGECT
jgi:hypothetical protein